MKAVPSDLGLGLRVRVSSGIIYFLCVHQFPCLIIYIYIYIYIYISLFANWQISYFLRYSLVLALLSGDGLS